MYRGAHITVIIPALNEEDSLGRVINDLPEGMDEVIVCDNGSTDNTATVAAEAGATVVTEPQRGYGAACLKAAEAVAPRTDILLFIDADYSDYPGEATMLLDRIIDQRAELVIGSRTRLKKSRQALTPLAVFGNWLSTTLIRRLWDVHFTDLGPFRAVRWESYKRMQMVDRDFGWTVEMQIRAAKLGMAVAEIPVSYRQRIGVSKISGTVSGSFKAGLKIIYLIGREALTDGPLGSFRK